MKTTDSKNTKEILSEAFKELLNEVPFSKISVGDICAKCDMNRKSFYYHFKDKYDLVNRIFDSEFPYLSAEVITNDSCTTFKDLCVYFYENKNYYRKIMDIEGQNSFTDHLSAELRNFLRKHAYVVDEFRAHFWADAVCCSMKDWILDKKCVHYSDFYRKFRSCVCVAVPLT